MATVTPRAPTASLVALTAASLAACALAGGCGTSQTDGPPKEQAPAVTAETVKAKPAPPPEREAQDPPLSFTATLHIAAKPGSKRLQAVSLKPEAGEVSSYLVDYRANGWWRPFEGQRLRVTGRRWSPDPRSQHVMAEHFRVETLEVLPTAKGPSGAYQALGPATTWRGTFETVTGQAGSKQAGETWTVLATVDGRRLRVISPTPKAADIGGERKVTGRLLTPSKHAAHSGGPVLWVRSIATP